MATQKRTKRQNSNKKRLFLIVAIGLILLSVLGLVVYRFAEQRRNLDELASAGKDLKVIYEKLLELNNSNVGSSSYGYQCSESSVEVGKGQVVCGPSATIVLKSGISADDSRRMIRDSLDVSNLTGRIDNLSASSGSGEVYTKFINRDTKIACLINHSTDTTFYLSCRKIVPDFLPGYTAEN